MKPEQLFNQFSKVLQHNPVPISRQGNPVDAVRYKLSAAKTLTLDSVHEREYFGKDFSLHLYLQVAYDESIDSYTFLGLLSNAKDDDCTFWMPSYLRTQKEDTPFDCQRFLDSFVLRRTLQ